MSPFLLSEHIVSEKCCNYDLCSMGGWVDTSVARCLYLRGMSRFSKVQRPEPCNHGTERQIFQTIQDAQILLNFYSYQQMQ